MMDTRSIEQVTSHRPWPLPAVPWVMVQSWVDLLFVHWRVSAAELRSRVPAALEIEEHDGSAWIGLTPFEVARLRPHLLPPLPGVGRFPEMNLRTYVRHGERPGIHFFTLDAANRIAVAAARTAYRLPYRTAHMGITRQDGWIHFRSERADGSAALDVQYHGIAPGRPAEPGTLEHFLFERYALYSGLADGELLRGEIHHLPWQLQRAAAVFERNTVLTDHGFGGIASEPLLHYAAQQDTLVWSPVPA
jgi:uncharacterized protein